MLVPEGSKAREAIVISNPLGEDYSIMRTLSLNGMLTSLATNYNHRNKDVRLYELANVYLPKALPLTELPDERMQLTLGMYGKGDFFDLKGVVEAVLDKLGIRKLITYTPEDDRPYLHPGRKADIMVDGQTIGFLGEIHPEVAENYNIGTKVYVAVLDVERLTELSNFDIKYVYEGEQLSADEKSLAYSIRFRAADRTLEDKDVITVMDKILKKLEAIDVKIRQ